MTANPYRDPRLAGAYQRGNEMPSSSLRAWAKAVTSYGPKDASTVLDVGTGTGMFAAAIAEPHDLRIVVGVDPSPSMLVDALRFNSHPRVAYVAGDAAALPIATESCDLVLLSRVIHHLRDRPICAKELRRVLRRDGVLVVRTTVRERLDALVYDYWPRLRETDRERFPSTDMIIADFETADLITTAVDSFAQPAYSSLRAYHDGLALRPQSKFAALSSEEFVRGLARLRRDADAAAKPCAVNERYDLLSFTAR